jgi:cyclic pyranopterin phosphate synthase
MEALTGVSAGLLCVLDMIKSLEKDEDGQYPHASINDIRVLEKIKR